MRKVLVFFLILQLFNKVLYTQGLSSEEKQSILRRLEDLSNKGYIEAIYDVIKFDVPESKQVLERDFWLVDKFYRAEYLLALQKYGSSVTKDYAHKYWDMLDSMQITDSLESKLLEISKIYTIKVLFLENDFQKTNYILELASKNKRPQFIIPLLPLIIKNNPVNSEQAFNLLKNLIKNSNDESVRLEAIFYYEDCYGADSINQLIDSFLEDNSPKVKLSILNKYFLKYKSTSINYAIKQSIKKESDTSLKLISSRILLNNYGTVEDYRFIKNEFINELNPLIKNYYFKLLNRFSPVIPSSNVKIEVLLDTLTAFINQSFYYSWLKDEGYKNNLLENLLIARNFIATSESLYCYKQIKSFQTSIQQVYSDSAGSYPKYVSKDAYKFLYYYPKYILERLPSPPTVKLEDSQGKLLRGGSLQYYEGSWKNAIDNGDGTFMLDTKLKTISLRMTYEYGSQTKNNLTVSKDAIVFKTVNAKVKLLNSKGTPIDTGYVQYYAGGWRNFGKTVNGIVSKELLPVNYSFRVTYGYGSNDKAQNIETNNTVEFTTVETKVELRNSLGVLIDQGTVQYYSGAWRDFGVTTNGIATKELLPNNYSFRMTYAYGSNDKQQNIGANPVVVFNTVRARVELRNSQGNLIDGGTVQYYSGGWREFGTTENGIAAKELLPNNYSFRMSYAFASNDKQQNIGDNATVVFQTINTIVELRNSQGNLIDGGVAQYYSGGWRNFGSTTNGTVNRELLPNNYSFRITHEYISSDKTQNIGTNRTVVFSTVLCTIQVRNAQNQPLNNALASYYSGGWRTIGNTVNGEITKELLPANLTFRVNYNGVQKDITQNLSTNNIVQFVF